MATKKEYISRVMLIMNDAGLRHLAENSLLGEFTEVDRVIEGCFVDAWRMCVNVMPRVWFKNASFAGQSIVTNVSDGTGYVVLPDNFYLIVRFKMSGWAKAVYEASVETDRMASIQSNTYTRGSTIRPVCTISNRLISGNVKPVLNYYSLPKNRTHLVEEAIYVPITDSLENIEDSAELPISYQAMEPLAYVSASLSFLQLGKYDISNALTQKAIEMFPGLQAAKNTNQ